MQRIESIVERHAQVLEAPALDGLAQLSDGLKTRPPADGPATMRIVQPAGLKGPLPRAAEGNGASLSSAKQLHASPWLGTGIRLLILLLVGGLTFLLTYEWNWWVGAAVQESTDDAYLQADLTPLAAKVPGYVRRVSVQDFQKVKAGDLLIELVDDDYRAQLDQAQANVAAAQATIDNIEQQKLLQGAVIKQAEAAILATEADLTRFHLETVRQQTLLAGRLAGTSQLTEQAVANEKRAEATLALNRRSSINSASSSRCWTARGRRRRRRSRRSRRHAISPRSTSATPA